MRGARILTSGLIAMALAVAPTSLLAGPTAPPIADQEKEVKPSKADRLEAIAMELLAEGETEVWEQAAELLEKSARLRPESSLKRASTLKLAANLNCWAGSKDHARELFQEAAELAAEIGEIGFAAHAYLDAAVISAGLKMGRHTIAATRSAEDLADKPEMGPDDRVAVRARLARLGAPIRLGEIM